MKQLKFLISILLFSLITLAQNPHPDLVKGNQYYAQQQYVKAATAYEKVLQTEPENFTALYNLAIVQFQQNNFDAAKATFQKVANKATDAALQSKAWYNQGVIATQEKNIEASIDYYKNALRQNPNDEDARENLQKALREIKKKEPPKKKEDDKKQDKKQQEKPQKQQSKLNKKEVEQRLKLLAQKEKEVQQRQQKEKTKDGGGQRKDW